MLGIQIDSNANVREVSPSACLAEAISVRDELPNEHYDNNDSTWIENALDETQNVSYSTAISEQTDNAEPNRLISDIVKNLTVIDLTESPISAIEPNVKLNTTFSPSKEIETVVVHDETFTERTSTEQSHVPVNNLTFSPIPNENRSPTNIMPKSQSVIDNGLVAEPCGVMNIGCKNTAVPSKKIPFHFGNSHSIAGHTKAFNFEMPMTSTPMPIFKKVNKGNIYLFVFE